MSSPYSIGSKARRATRVTGLLGLTSLMLPVYLAHQRVRSGAMPVTLKSSPEARARRDAYVALYTGAILKLFGVTLVEVGTKPPRTSVGRLVVSNHRSGLDVALMLRLFGGRLVARGDIKNWPLLGQAAESVGTLFVDRNEASSGAAIVRTMTRTLEGGDVVGIFPEGTTFAGDEVRPFHRGAFIAASASRAEILPVGIAYDASSGASYVQSSFGEHLKDLGGALPFRVAVAYGEPFSAASARSGALERRTHGEVELLVRSARAALDAREPRRHEHRWERG